MAPLPRAVETTAKVGVSVCRQKSRPAWLSALLLAAMAMLALILPAHAGAEEGPAKVAIGVYINDIYDLDLPSNSFNADIYV
ncbi:MAG: hypothetical protein O2892_09935 [Actinomycetota bacterium]|nr:hypothetical protein [Actinomycetota bacterium]MDA2949346.1 hypothetical protein [Actinomycetota bacterium]